MHEAMREKVTFVMSDGGALLWTKHFAIGL